MYTPGSLRPSEKEIEWTPGQWRSHIPGASSEEECSQEEEEESLLPVYNQAMAVLSKNKKTGKFTPLDFQLKTSWEETTEAEKEVCIDKAIDRKSVV